MIWLEQLKLAAYGQVLGGKDFWAACFMGGSISFYNEPNLHPTYTLGK